MQTSSQQKMNSIMDFGDDNVLHLEDLIDHKGLRIFQIKSKCAITILLFIRNLPFTMQNSISSLKVDLNPSMNILKFVFKKCN